MGPHRHIVTYPIRGGRDLNVVCIKEQADWSDEGWNHPDDPSVLKREFGDFIGLLPVFDQVHTLHKWGLFRHPVADTWAEGNVAIMGDAAHPTLPFLAQGAIMAIEDAWVLAACLIVMGWADYRPINPSACRGSRGYWRRQIQMHGNIIWPIQLCATWRIPR